MKDLSSRLLAAMLLVPMLVVLGTILLAGSHSQAASSGSSGQVQVAFDSPPGTLTTADGSPIPTEYRQVILNIIAVRLNPSSNPKVSGGWVRIPAPPPAAPGIFKLDLKALQNLPFLFNAAAIPPKTYKQVELVLDPVNPVTVVPLCTSTLEGCRPYNVAIAGRIRGLFASGYTVTNKSRQPLVVTIGGTLGPGASAALSVTPEDNTTAGGVTYNPALGVVTGSVANFDLKKTAVTAEFSGTNQIVSTTKLRSDGSFTFNLPALDASGGGTFYDFYVAGNGGYVVVSHKLVVAQGSSGSLTITDLGTLAVPNSKLNGVSGRVFDACVGNAKPIEGATLQLLVPDTSTAPESDNCDLTGTPPAIPTNCVVVGTAATDQRGVYPLPSGASAFNHVPASPPSGVTHYDLEVSAPGYNTVLQVVEKNSQGRLDCPASGFKKDKCSFNLEHGFMAGTVSLASPNDTGGPLNVMVNAEDSGTNKIENFTIAQIPPGQSSGSFSMPVPNGTPIASADATLRRGAPAASPTVTPTPPVPIPVTSYDVFAVVQDRLGGTRQKISGHTLAVIAGVSAPPPTPTPSPTPSSTPSSSPSPSACSTVSVELPAVDCVGDGSAFGTVSDANPQTTSVVLSKLDESDTPVQIEQTDPDSIGLPATGNNFYDFCAPVDDYIVTHYESSPGASPSPVASAEVSFATPAATPSPCIGICGNTADSCLLCQNAAGPDL